MYKIFLLFWPHYLSWSRFLQWYWCLSMPGDPTNVIYYEHVWCKLWNESFSIIYLLGWFGLRKDFCTYILDKCPMLQKYGNISYSHNSQQSDNGDISTEANKDNKSCCKKQLHVFTDEHVKIPTIYLDMPDWCYFTIFWRYIYLPFPNFMSKTFCGCLLQILEC